MSSDGKRPALGRGLSALLGDDSEDYAQLDRIRSSRQLGIDQLRANRLQPRQDLDTSGLEELAQSIAEKGVLQPILVRRHPDEPGAFEIIAGERRWRAAQMAGLHDVPVVVRELDDREALEIALIENLQRRDLSPLEEAEGYQRLMQEFGHTQEELARVIAKSRSHVANTLRLLALPDAVKALLKRGDLSAGHARALLTIEHPEALARTVVARGLNVRQTERLAGAARAEPRRPRATAKDANTEALERELSTLLGLAVEIRVGRGGGTLMLHYRSLDQLDHVVHRLSRGADGRASPATGEEAGEEPWRAAEATPESFDGNPPT